MLLITGNWQGALISEDGRQETQFSFSGPLASGSAIQGLLANTPRMSFAGNAPASWRLLEGARNALVALVDTVPDPSSGCLAQVLLDMRVLGDRLVGHWLRRDMNGVMISAGKLVAVRQAVAA